MSTGDRRGLAATTVCPVCGVTVMGRGDDPAGAAVAAADALDQHLNDHKGDHE